MMKIKKEENCPNNHSILVTTRQPIVTAVHDDIDVSILVEAKNSDSYQIVISTILIISGIQKKLCLFQV